MINTHHFKSLGSYIHTISVASHTMRWCPHFVLFLSVCVVVYTEVDRFRCELYCYVTEENTTVYHANCSYRNLSELPEFKEDVADHLVSLDLVGNKFINLTNLAWDKFKLLKTLSLAKNRIEKLDDNCFINLTELEVLDLSLNHIRYCNISEAAFKPLVSLRYLDLKQNLSDILPEESYPNSLSHLKSLTTLLIDGLQSISSPTVSGIKELYMSGEYGRCNISKLNGHYFTNAVNITHLYMSNCSILLVENETFIYLPHLHSLDLARNTQLTKNVLQNITFHPFKSLRRLNLNSMYDYINYDLCSSLDVEDVRHLRDMSIEMMMLEKNYIIRMQEEAVDYLPKSLKYVSISDNMFAFGKYVTRILETNKLSNLVYFDTSKMFKNHIPISNAFPIAIRHSDATLLTPDTICLSLEQFLRLSNSTLTRTHVLDEFEVIIENMKRNGIQPDRAAKSEEKNQSKLEYLDLSENLPGTIQMTFEIFKKTPNLSFLNVSNNYLGYPLLDKQSNRIFESVNKLRTLDLSNNRITRLMPDIFDNMTKLEQLYLSNNSISTIAFNVKRLKSLTYLDMASNHLEKLSKKTTEALDQMTKIKLNLAGNPLLCTCPNMKFVKWLRENIQRFENIEDTVCIFDNSTVVNFVEFDFDAFHSECLPPNYHAIILAVSLCIVAFVIIVSCGLVYRFKWNLRYLYYMTKFKLIEGYQPINNREFETDVFVSYANEDGGFVRDNLVPQLENKGNLSLLVHNRDFRAGELVTDNIMRAITSSRRTLVLLTKEYIKSKWCMYEMNMARMEAADTGRNVLCVVLKEDIPMKYIPIEVLDIIKNKTYIEFPKERQHKELFWERLRMTLVHDT